MKESLRKVINIPMFTIGVAFLLISVGLLVKLGVPNNVFHYDITNTVGFGISNREFDKIQSGDNLNTNITVRSHKEIWDIMHRMANTKIEAEVIWGRVMITEERVNRLILEVEKSNYRDKRTLLGFLYKWKNGDFSGAVVQHNYLWSCLGGTIGRAKGLKK